MKTNWLKSQGGLIPADPNAEEWLTGTKLGQLVNIDVTRPRNYAFHKKYFALVTYAFSQWETPDGTGKNYDRFRDELSIMAGFFDKVWTISGELRLVAKSISFASMDEAEFQELYSKTVDIILAKILTSHSESDIDKSLNEIMGFL